MRTRNASRRGLAFGFAFASLFGSTGLRADDAAVSDGRRSAIVAQVGPQTILVGDVESGLAAMPRFQRAAWGGTAAAIRHGYLDEVLVPQALLSLAAQSEALEAHPPTSYAVERARSGATVRAIRARIGSAASISMDDVRAYYAENRATFETPERYHVWRILCRTRDDAESVLKAAKKEPTTKLFADLARGHSQDRGTFLRGGDLGFVTADGVSKEPGLRVDAAVMRAVLAVHDGDFVATPVPEGQFFAIIWRRGRLEGSHRTVEDAAPAIRDTLWKDRIQSETDQLLARLRAERVHDVNEAPLASADIAAVAARGSTDAAAAPSR